MKLSLSMIVKNEEKVIARALSSCYRLFDEIIIVDTGSTDNTKAICKKFTDKIYDFTWQNDFSLARNYSFSLATGDYIFWLDADDVISPKNAKIFENLRGLLEKENPDIVFCPYVTNFDEQKNPTFQFMRERIVKANKFLWTGAVHECIIPYGKTVNFDGEIHHYSAKKNYTDRNLKIYKSLIKKGVALDDRHALYYAKEYFYLGKYKTCKTLLDRFLKRKNLHPLYLQDAVCILGQSCENLGDTLGGINAYLKCFSFGVPTPEILCRLANIYKNFNENFAIFYYKCALSCPKGQFGGFENLLYNEFIPCLELSVLLYKKEYKKAKHYHQRAKNLRPNDKTLLFNDKFFKN